MMSRSPSWFWLFRYQRAVSSCILPIDHDIFCVLLSPSIPNKRVMNDIMQLTIATPECKLPFISEMDTKNEKN